MILSRTPYRVSFFGGGTDYPAFYRREGGAVLSTAIDKYCWVSARVLPPFFEARHRVVWSHIERVDSIDEILHPAVRAGLRFLGFGDEEGLEIHHQGDLPARAGIASSAAFAVGLIHALTTLRGERLEVSDLARKAIELEQDVLREHVGCQDQVAAAHGGLNRIRFHSDGAIEVEPLQLSDARRDALEQRLVLIYTGSSRLGPKVAAAVIENIPARTAALRRMRAMVDEAVEILSGDQPLDDFGALLHEAWMHKRGLADPVTSPQIDAVYEQARAEGALGGKLLGAGSTGFMCLYVPPERQEAVEKALARYVRVPFRFEPHGTRIIQNAGPW